MKNCVITAIIVIFCVSLMFSADWEMISKIVASDRDYDDFFGRDVAVSGNFAIVGAYRNDQSAEEGGILVDPGTAYIFRFDGSKWVEMQKLVAPIRHSEDHFGYSVDICGNYALVGSHQESIGDMIGSGAAYIFYYDGTSWILQDKLIPNDLETGDHFGYSVALTENKAVVGAVYEDDNILGEDSIATAGSAYVFARSGSVWSQQAKLIPTHRAQDNRFGYHVAISGYYILVSSPYDDYDADSLNYEVNAGAAYVFHNDGSGWTQQQKLIASDRDMSDGFGHRADIDGTTIIVGAYMEDHDADGLNKIEKAGSAYIFDRSGSVWSETQKIVASERWASDFFGRDVALEDDLLIVGADGEDHDTLAANYIANAGAAYIFKKIGGSWTEQEKITEPYRREEDAFGNDVAISGDVVFVSAPSNDLNADELNLITSAGAVYVFSSGIGGIIEPNIYVHADSVEISNGDNTPSPEEHTDFGEVYIDSGATILSYTIANTGTGYLNIDTIYVVDSWGENFTVQETAPDSLAPGTAGTFSILFTPSDTTLRTGSVNIISNDPDESPYTFLIQGKGVLAEVSIAEKSHPGRFALLLAYPNPFNPNTLISYKLSANSCMKLNIYNVQGILVDQLVNGYVEAGCYDLVWNPGNMPSGVYIVRMTAGNFITSQKVVLVK